MNEPQILVCERIASSATGRTHSQRIRVPDQWATLAWPAMSHASDQDQIARRRGQAKFGEHIGWRFRSFARVTNCTHDNKDAPKDTIPNPHEQGGNLLKNCVGRHIDKPREQAGKQ